MFETILISSMVISALVLLYVWKTAERVDLVIRERKPEETLEYDFEQLIRPP